MCMVKDLIAKTIEENTVCLHTNQWDYKVRACKLLDNTTKQMAYGLFVQLPDGSLSDRVVLKKSKLKGRNAMDWLLDYIGGFDRADIDEIKWQLIKGDKELPIMETSSKLSVDEVYRELCEYVEGNEIGDIISIKDGYCNIEVNEFKKIVEEQDFGYKALELKKAFKEYGLLRINKGRAYDYNMTDKDKNTYKTISIKYVAVSKEETECQ